MGKISGDVLLVDTNYLWTLISSLFKLCLTRSHEENGSRLLSSLDHFTNRRRKYKLENSRELVLQSSNKEDGAPRYVENTALLLQRCLRKSLLIHTFVHLALKVSSIHQKMGSHRKLV